MAVGVALTGLFAKELFPRHRLAAVAAGVTAVVPTVVTAGGAGHNDGTAFAFTAACLWVAALMLRRGLSTSLLVIACVVATGAMLTRSSALPAAAAVVGAAGLSATRAGGGALRRALVRGLCAMALIVATVTVGAGWLYWRNNTLYGSPTADTYLLEMFHRQARSSTAAALVDRRFHGRCGAGCAGRWTLDCPYRTSVGTWRHWQP